MNMSKGLRFCGVVDEKGNVELFLNTEKHNDYPIIPCYYYGTEPNEELWGLPVVEG